MTVERDFFEDYAAALGRRSAALFVGAGLSMAADFPDWKTLLDGVAEEIGLDVQKERDLPALAQFYLNRFANNRGRIADLVCRTFRRRPAIPENHRILARLPFRHVWTTNYDELLERAWELHDQRMDVKSRNADLTTSDPEASAVLFKMHGTATQPDEIVLTRDDYELYGHRRPGFLQILGSDLITSTFLFLGLSFTDPNLRYLMGALRAAFQSAPRQHYAILRPPADDYDRRRFLLFIDDLQRYGIRTLLVPDYSGITSVLQQLERRYAQKNVFVAGSFPEDGDAAEREHIERVASGVGRLIAQRGLSLVSGFGRVVGNHVVAGFIDELYRTAGVMPSDRLTVCPIRQVSPEGMSSAEFKRRYREDMISQSGIVIVIGGRRKDAIAPGVLEEFEIAKGQGKVVLPIAATGHAARQIYEQILERPGEHLPPGVDRGLLQRLGPETREVDDIKRALGDCLTAVGRRP